MQRDFTEVKASCFFVSLILTQYDTIWWAEVSELIFAMINEPKPQLFTQFFYCGLQKPVNEVNYNYLTVSSEG